MSGRPMNQRDVAWLLEQDLRANRRPEISNAGQLDVQALCVAEEAGGLIGAYRRSTGKARCSGTLRELENEVADLLIETAVFAERDGIDIIAAVARMLAVIYSCNWRKVRDG